MSNLNASAGALSDKSRRLKEVSVFSRFRDAAIGGSDKELVDATRLLVAETWVDRPILSDVVIQDGMEDLVFDIPRLRLALDEAAASVGASAQELIAEALRVSLLMERPDAAETAIRRGARLADQASLSIADALERASDDGLPRVVARHLDPGAASGVLSSALWWSRMRAARILMAMGVRLASASDAPTDSHVVFAAKGMLRDEKEALETARLARGTATAHGALATRHALRDLATLLDPPS